MHRPRKRFGQHFLHDGNIIDKILRAIGISEGDKFLEIGPGRGALTIPLLKRCKKLIAVELDRDLVPLLNQATGRHWRASGNQCRYPEFRHKKPFGQ